MKKIIQVDQSKFKSLISKICRDMSISNWRPDYIVGLTRGGLIPAVMISHYFDIPMYALHVTSKPENNESNLWMSEDAFGWPADGRKNILIVDDINDSGATLNWIKQDWQSSCLPNDERWNDVWGNNVRFAGIKVGTVNDIEIVGENTVRKIFDKSLWSVVPTITAPITRWQTL